jgi:phosphoribosylformylglycinamidine cyclo-ligase
LTNFGVKSFLAGGETADVGDIVKTIIVDSTVFTSLKKEKVIENHLQPGDVIVGFASFGKATYEKEYNSGIGSNGLTFARHELFNKSLKLKYPESYDHNIPEQYVYTGKYLLTDSIPNMPLNIGKMALSPTRTYAPLIQEILQNHSDDIHGIIHCTGGGQTKVMHFIDKLHIIKNNLFDVPPIFQLIQESSNADWKEMYSVFNMGHRLEIYTNKETAQKLIDISHNFGIEAKIIGYCEESSEKKMTLFSPLGELIYK